MKIRALSSPFVKAMAAALVAASLSLGLGKAHASALEPMDVETLTAKADRILVGRVESADSHFLAPGSSYIVTDVTLVRERRLFGGPDASRFVVRRLGGEVGKRGQRVYGEATYRVGERVMLFAVERQGVFYALGMSNGVLHVYDDEAGVARIRTLPGRSLADVVALVQSVAARRAETR